MRLDMTQGMRLRQEMRLTPQLIQSMEILQLPAMALEERIREEMEKNPALEMAHSKTEIAATDFGAAHGTVDESPASRVVEPGIEITRQEERVANERESYERQYEEYGDNYIPTHQPSKWAGVELSDRKQDAMLNMADRPESLEEHLLQQLTLREEAPNTLAFAAHVVANLDDKGFLRTPLGELRMRYEGEIDEDQAEEALAIVQDLEPAGVGARDLGECLLLQLDDPDPTFDHVPLLRRLVQGHLEDISHNRLPVVEKKLGVPMAELRAALAELRRLDPHPAARFNPTPTQYVVPDLRMEIDAEGKPIAVVNDDSIPNVGVSQQYIDALKSKLSEQDAHEYIKRKIAQARDLIEAIMQRRNTLRKVAQAIIDHQRDFLELGPEHVQPLKMQNIADAVGVHVTTVSRAVDEKWIETPRGLLPLRGFFGAGAVTADGKEVSYDIIKRRLRDMVDAEDKADPLSDDALEQKMNDAGYPLARRTITKYRKELGIPSSRERKAHE